MSPLNLRDEARRLLKIAKNNNCSIEFVDTEDETTDYTSDVLKVNRYHKLDITVHNLRYFLLKKNIPGVNKGFEDLKTYYNSVI